MPIYKQVGNKLQQIKERQVGYEKSIQTLVEANLPDIFGLDFVCSEYQLKNLRIDTLAFDEEVRAFVIIEYKKDKSFSVVDQGYAYLALLLNNKADFILEYNERHHKNLKKNDVEWSQSRVIFVAQSFTKYQQEAMGFRDLPIELWEVRLYGDNLVLFNELRASEKSESIKTVTKGKDVEAVTTEIKQYSVDDLIKPEWEDARGLFEELSQRMLGLDSRFEIRPVKSYIGFRLGSKNVINVKPRKTKLVIELLRTQPQDLNDPEKRAKYFENSFQYYNQHVSTVEIENSDDIDYVMLLIRQVYKRFVE